MSNTLLTRCPYCGRKISYPGAMLIKKKGEYYCYKCQCTSNVVIHHGLSALAAFVCVLAVLLMLLFSMFGNHEDLKNILWIVLPFVVFYIATPFFIKLEPFNDKIYPMKRMPKRIFDKKNKSAKPVQLDVENDFSQKFMLAKNNADQKIVRNTGEMDNSLPKDISNTEVLFDLNQNSDDKQ